MTTRIYTYAIGEIHSGGIIILDDADVKQYLINIRAKGDWAQIMPDKINPHPNDIKREKRRKAWVEAWDRVWRGEDKISERPICDPPSKLCCYKREWED